MVAGLMLSGSSVQYTGLMGLIARLSVAGMRLVSTARYARMQRNLLLPTLPPAWVEDIADAGFSAQGSRDALAAMLGRDFFSLLQGYRGAVLIANGENDALNGRYEARSAVLPCSAVESIPRSGHLCSLEQPLAYSGVVRRFAASLSSADQLQVSRLTPN